MCCVFYIEIDDLQTTIPPKLYSFRRFGAAGGENPIGSFCYQKPGNSLYL